MTASSRITIVETKNELLITNPPRGSAFRIGFVLVGAGIVAYTSFMALSDTSPSTAAAGTFGLLSFLAIIALFTYLLGKDFIWLVFGKETLRMTKDMLFRDTSGGLIRNHASLALRGQLSVEILDHTYPTDETGLEEVVRLSTADGAIIFGRELSRPEAEAVAAAVSGFIASQKPNQR